ncbi:efflux RND transporter periplasmic adaptor subunit [Roseivirga sp.]|uniref:efflux RND transporter periplasmic adaptor subunit n=1 Tax=Roseivirga sp. TaxID=1964215 RepID=UPI003B8D2B68
MKFNKSILLTIGVALVVGAAVGALLFGNKAPQTQEESHQHEVDENGLWTCSMHPQVRQPESGSCPFCGMDLIPLANGDSGDPTILKMSNAAMQLANIETAIIGSSEKTTPIRLNGKIKVDDRLVNLQTTHFEGRVEELYKGFEGDVVTKGEKVASIYSPELVTAQEELIAAKKLADTNPVLLEAARKKLHHWKLSMDQIMEIEKSNEPLRNFDLLSDYTGVVTKKVVNNGTHLHEGGGLVEITDLTSLWAVFEVYERDLNNISLGQKVSFKTSRDNEQYAGVVSFISPNVDPNTRVVEVRADVRNRGLKLKPDMFIETSISPNSVSALVVPKSAVLWTGKRSIVYVKIPNESSFQLREVVLGDAIGNAYLIEEGLKAGDEVVTNGAFTLDAESQLKGNNSMMNPLSPTVAPEKVIFEEIDLPEPKDLSDKAGAIFQEQIGALSIEYIALKDAMVAGDGSTIRKIGVSVRNALNRVESPSQNEEVNAYWGSLKEPMRQSLELIAKTGDRDAQRLEFINLSKALINALKAFGTSSESPFYVQYCPMANNNTGATWISREEEIINPYFGDVMLNCGNVEEVINPNN